MLQQTQVKTVIPYWVRWIKALPTLQSLAAAPIERLYKLWEGLGYYRRVRNLQTSARIIVAQHGGKFPEPFEQVLALPGIGRYTAGAICSIAFDQPNAILDGNVIRVLSRVFGIRGNPAHSQTRRKLWDLAQDLVNHANQLRSKTKDGSCARLNQALMELGALVCTPRNPLCELCTLRPHCRAFQQKRVDKIPNQSRRVAPINKTSISLVLENDLRFLVRQRSHGTVNGNLWEFPRKETTVRAPSIELLFADEAGIPFRDLVPLCQFKHSITRYRISAKAFRAKVTEKCRAHGRWLPLKEIFRLPLTSADSKILHALRHSLKSEDER